MLINIQGEEMKSLLFASLIAICLNANAGSKFSKSTPELITKGQQVYTQNCTVCHGDKMDGNGPAGAALNPKPRNLIADQFKSGDKPEQIYTTLEKGLKGTMMSSFAHLKEDEKWALVHFLKSKRQK